ncbi:MAG: carcinine hydrolase/isopenicillin-N N-acyltransferase family protein [Planctomycetota bacterium]
MPNKIAVYSSCIILLFFASVKCTSKKDSQRTNSFIPGSCTIFTVVQGKSVFFGNNEDWYNPLTFYWVEPPSQDNYGVLYFGYDNLFPQGGINEKGLAYDANALPDITAKKHPERLKPPKAIVNELIMQKCATVNEAIEMAKSYDWSQCYMGKIDGQFMLADASGDAVVIGGDSNGEIVFTRKQAGDGFLVSTNYNLTDPENRYGRYPCKRYNTAVKMLSEIKNENDLTADYLASILDKVHAEGKGLNTLFSNIFDLKKGLIYLYYWHQFDYVVTLDVAEIIALQPQPAQIKTLFPEAIIDQASSEYDNYQKRPMKIAIGIAIIAIVFWASFSNRKFIFNRVLRSRLDN